MLMALLIMSKRPSSYTERAKLVEMGVFIRGANFGLGTHFFISFFLPSFWGKKHVISIQFNYF